jgi:hypothetical protein
MASAVSLTFRATLFCMLVCILKAAPAFAQRVDISQGFEKCKVISDDQARLNCLKNLIPGTSPDPGASSTLDLWPLVRTPNPKGGPDAVAIMRMADTGQSDPDLAGLMIRCTEKSGLEVVLALVRPFPPLAKTDVVVNSGTTQSVLHAKASSIGTALILPVEATAFTIGPWRDLKELAVTIKHPETEIHGTIPLDGASPAIARLSASCPPG